MGNLLDILPIPGFIAVIWFLSYLVWSKFINQNKDNMYTKNIDSFLEILVIFVFLFISISGIMILLGLSVQIFSLSLNSIWIRQCIPIFDIIIGIVGIIIFAIIYTNKECNRNSLNKFFNLIFNIYLLFGVIFTTYLLVILFTPYKSIAMEKMFLELLTVFFIITIFLCISLFQNKIFKFKFNKSIISLIILISIITFLITLFITPSIHLAPLESKNYVIDNYYSNTPDIYIYKIANMSVKKFGLFPKYFVVNYKHLGFIADPPLSSPNNIHLTLNLHNSSTGYSGLSVPYEKAYDNASLIIKFQKNQFPRNNLTLEGLTLTNISNNLFVYNYNNQPDECINNNCKIEILVNNSLDYPVELTSGLLNNIKSKITDSNNCKFNKINVEYQSNGSKPSYTFLTCDNSTTSCSSNSYLSYPFAIIISNLGGGVIFIDQLQLEKAMNIEFDIFIDC